MRTLVIFESMFGNTRDIALAIGDGLRSWSEVDMVEVGEAPTDPGDAFDLVVVGGPTHAFGMSRAGTRQSAIDQGAPARVHHLGIRDWLSNLAIGARGLVVVTFDTRLDKPRVPGSAARSAVRAFKKLGIQPIARPEHFYVSDVAGPLLEGEVERARQWGADLATSYTNHRAASAAR